MSFFLGALFGVGVIYFIGLIMMWRQEGKGEGK